MNFTAISMEALINAIPGGIASLHVSDTIKIKFANDIFYQIIGYSKEEFESCLFCNNYLSIVHPNDRTYLMGYMQSCPKDVSKSISIIYRALHKNKDICWMRTRALLVEEDPNGVKEINCFIYDISREKIMEKEACIYEKYLSIISDQLKDIIYDWNLETGLVHYTYYYKLRDKSAVQSDLLFDDFLSMDMIHKEDKGIIQKAIKDIKNGKQYLNIEYRIKKLNNVYIWKCNRMSVILDDYKNPSQVVGIITDIDLYKKESALLKVRAQQDPLTGLLNRQTMQEMIEDFLEKSESGKQHAFFLIDIDNFKCINDSLGHIAGDAIIAEASTRLIKQFREHDIVCRMGGDEFAILMIDVPSIDAVFHKAEQLNAICRRDFQFEGKCRTLSISIGAAIYPGHGRTFQELYKNADIALYQSKHKGRDQFSFYSP